MLKTQILFLAYVLSQTVLHKHCDAFSILNSPISSSSSLSQCCRRRRPLYLSAESKDTLEQDEAESSEIRKLILDLSKIANDAERRTNVSNLLNEKLNQSNVSDSAKFAHLWDLSIIKIGAEIQNEARMDAERRASVTQEGESSVESKTNDGDDGDDGDDKKSQSENKSETELQLWSMVDMMVQSKSIIKELAK